METKENLEKIAIKGFVEIKEEEFHEYPGDNSTKLRLFVYENGHCSQKFYREVQTPKQQDDL